MPASPHTNRPAPSRERIRRGLRIAAWVLISGTLGSACTTTTRPEPPSAPPPPAGSIKGSATVHDAASRSALVARAQLALPAAANGGAVYLGPWRDRPVPGPMAKLPVVLFMHGSSGLGLKAIGEWQRWLAGLGVASVAPDSFALPDRLTYVSPVDRATYERIHALRTSEIAPMLDTLRTSPWVDPARIVLAGTSEGSVAVARHAGDGFAGRLIYTWSCEDNYFVGAARTATAPTLPVLNVISSTDPYFSSSNAWLDRPQAHGHCGAALAAHPRATIVLIPGAPHTLLNLPAARDATAAFVRDVLRP